MRLFTIGFTQKAAERFFNILKNADVKRIIDIRLNNVSQLAGFAKRDDLQFFLKEICKIDYIHLPDLAPTKEIMDAFKKKKGDWSVYRKDFIDLMAKRNIENKYKGKLFDGDCFLCSETTAEHCHRRLVSEYLAGKWGDIEIEHL